MFTLFLNSWLLGCVLQILVSVSSNIYTDLNISAMSKYWSICQSSSILQWWKTSKCIYSSTVQRIFRLSYTLSHLVTSFISDEDFAHKKRSANKMGCSVIDSSTQQFIKWLKLAISSTSINFTIEMLLSCMNIFVFET